ncbi:DNA-binding protein [Sunxiuqinia dokdonensis]|uniref:DNA-binding protein n=1 Tax=Sunxiuqinia dokdonensis TaxID=1409788 RepID=A0A0L8V5A9_9BACT|nr:DNA-binding protein [Sunxiuqinia dokdonensis]
MKYKLVERGKPGDPDAPKKLYASPVKTGTKTISSLSGDIADISSLSRGDINSVITNLVERIPKDLLEGNSVSLGELGTLRISFSSEGVADEADFHTSKIKGLKVIFTPGKLIKEELKRAKFNK